MVGVVHEVLSFKSLNCETFYVNTMEIREFDYVVLKKDTNLKIVQILLNKPLSMCKMKFVLNGIIGHSFGSSFVAQNGQLSKVTIADINGGNADPDEEAMSRDNRQLVDSCENQQLTKNEIITLRKQGASGEEIVGQLIENSATFASKTEFSQQKYIKKKKQKHVAMLTVLKPTARTLVELYYSRGPTKICNLRLDSLSQILTYCNVRAGSRLMVVESCNGLLLGAILERLDGCGSVVHMYTGSAPSRQAITDGFHFSDKQLDCLHSFPLNRISSLRRPSFARKSTTSAVAVATSSLLSHSTLPSAAMSPGDSIVTPILSANSTQAETLPDASVVAAPAAGLCEAVAYPSPLDTTAGTVALPSTPSDSSVTSVMHLSDAGLSQPSMDADNCSSVEKMDEEPEDKSPGVSSKMPNTGASTLLPQSVAATKLSTADRPSGWKRKWKQDDEEREKRKAVRNEQVQQTKSILEAADLDGLVIAAKLHPTPVVLSLLDFIKPSRPIVVFSPYKEPLIDCFVKLRETGRVLLMSVSETWLRGYQVLPDRTHPGINMSGSGGYLLTATVVAAS